MANPLDWAARAILQINGMSAEEITKRARQLKAGKGQKPMPKANTTRPATAPTTKPVVRQSRVNGRLVKGPDTRGNRPIAKAKPPAPPKPGSIQPKGQTNAFSKNGAVRDFRNPRVYANRPPTLSPVESRSSARPTPPRPPIGGPGRQSPGQGSLNLGAGERTGNKNPWGPGTSPRRQQAQQGTPRKAPDVPKAGTGTKPATPKAPEAKAPSRSNQRWVDNNTRQARVNRQIALDKAGQIARTVGVAGTAAALATSNFGNEGEKPDVRARRLGFKDAADQKAKIEAQKRSTSPKRTPEQAIKDAKAQPRSTTPRPEYKRPKAQVKTPSAAQQATDKRDKKKLF